MAAWPGAFHPSSAFTTSWTMKARRSRWGRSQTLSDLRLTRDPVVFTTEGPAEILPGVCDALDYAHFQRKDRSS